MAEKEDTQMVGFYVILWYFVYHCVYAWVTSFKNLKQARLNY